MNRLVIIGNGFDLAHGYKTSYFDFFSNYIIKATVHANSHNVYEDELIKINLTQIKSITDEDLRDINKLFEVFNHNSSFKLFTIKSSFFEYLYNNYLNKNWVDIEKAYFFSLKTLKSNNSKDKINKLNNDFEIIKTKLIDYLKTINVFEKPFRGNYINSLIDNDFEQLEMVYNLENKLKPEIIHILNFNYTNTIELYIHNLNPDIQIELNFIHGDLKNDKNPIIFGYGDEYDKNYLTFEDSDNKELFKHIKSFQYALTSNYHNLLKFVQAEPFQVHVLGHSLGLSDRTMLKQIFENDNCKSIKLYYYKINDNEDDFNDKVYELARHFTDKGKMREKLVPKEKSLTL